VAGDPNVDHRADIYAFGATAYELLTGQPPFARRSVAEQMSAHLVEEPAPLSTVRATIPLALEQLVARCLEKEPGRRPQSANEILTSLDDPAVVSGEVASAQTPSLVLRRRAVRRWWPGVAAAVVAVVGAAGWLMTRKGAEAPPAPVAAAVVRPAPSGMTSLAVFPLVSISQDSSDSYIAAGMTEALTNAFAGLPSVRVTSRTAAATALGQGQAPESVAKQLGVTMYVEGTVQRARDRLRVTVRLVDATDGFTVWSDVYESDGADLLATQSEISARVADAFSKGTFDPASRQSATTR
jgi:serine/threonine-protein kinase